MRDFADDARSADFAIVYFAGHGIEIQGTNYLIPIDAVLERDIDAFDEAIPLDRLLNVIEPAKQLRLVILDACRDNPFAKTMKHAVASRAIDRGLAKVEPMSPNTLIAYAAKAGSTAADGNSKNSPFTAALVKYLPTPGLDLRMAFGFVRDDVMKVTRNRQEPFIYGSLGGNDVALVPKRAGADRRYLAPPRGTITTWRRRSTWSRHGSPSSRNIRAGFYSDLARAQRDKLMRQRKARRVRAERRLADPSRRSRRRQMRERRATRRQRSRQPKCADRRRKGGGGPRPPGRAARRRQKARQTRGPPRRPGTAAARKAGEARLAAERKAAEKARLAAEKTQAAERGPAGVREKVARAEEGQRVPSRAASAAGPGGSARRDWRRASDRAGAAGRQQAASATGCAGTSAQKSSRSRWTTQGRCRCRRNAA